MHSEKDSTHEGDINLGAFNAKEYLDKHFTDIQSLIKAPQYLEKAKKVHDGLVKKRKNLEHERTKLLSSSLRSLENTNTKLDEIDQLRTQLITTVRNKEKKSANLNQHVNNLLIQYQTLQQNRAYMQLLLKVTAINEKATQAQGIHQAIEPFLQLVDIHKSLEPFPCKHLKAVAKNYVDGISETLTQRMKSSFNESLTAIQWPTPVIPGKVSEKAIKQFLETFSFLVLQQNALQKRGVPLGKNKDSIWALDLLLEPIVKRFRFHFEGNKPTNNIEKPEWYFTHTLNLISNHMEFFLTRLQPILNEQGLSYIGAKNEFIKGLVKAVNHKIEMDLPTLLENREIYFHTINETISFEKTLRNIHSYPTDDALSAGEQVTCLEMFTEDKKALDAWIELEKHYAFSQLETMRTKETAWDFKFRNLNEADEMKLTEYADSLMSLLYNITERYLMIPKVGHRLRFLEEIQLKVLREFHDQIAADVKHAFRWAQSYVTKDRLITFCRMADTVQYVKEVLKDWSDEVHFVELQLYKKNPKAKLEDAVSDNNAVSGSVFESIISSLKLVKKEMTISLLKVVMSSFEKGSYDYFRKRLWTSQITFMKGVPEQMFDLSTEIAEALSLLKVRIEIMSENLSFFGRFWKKLALALDYYIFEQITSKHHFTLGGALQFAHDMKALFLLFRPFTSNPELYFKSVKDACTLLTLDRSQLQAVKKVIDENENKWNSSLLLPFGIHKLNLEQVNAVLFMYIEGE